MFSMALRDAPGNRLSRLSSHMRRGRKKKPHGHKNTAPHPATRTETPASVDGTYYFTGGYFGKLVTVYLLVKRVF